MSCRFRWAIVEFVLGILSNYWVGVPFCLYFGTMDSSFLEDSICFYECIGFCFICGIRSFADLIAYRDALSPGKVVGLTGASTIY